MEPKYPNELYDLIHETIKNFYHPIDDGYVVATRCAEAAYRLGLESGWAYEQDTNRMQRDED